jgi:hypothetical protein
VKWPFLSVKSEILTENNINPENIAVKQQSHKWAEEYFKLQHYLQVSIFL